MKGWLLGLLALLILVAAGPYLLGLLIITAVTVSWDCVWPVQPSTAMADGDLRLPLVGRYRISSPYGDRVHPVTGEYRHHNGLDLSMTPHGGPVLAMATGTVTAAGPAGAAGNRVVVDHGHGLVSKYFHLARIDVTTGQSVPTGTQLGTEGATGRVTGAHLHWEVWVNGAPTDPQAWATAQGLVLDGEAPELGQLTPAAAETVRGTLAVAADPLNPTALAARPPTAVGAWDAEQLGNAAEIIAAGTALGLDEWTLTVGVMTAIGESTLRNVDHGDAAGPDSRGLFQQRANGAWGSYADRMNPRVAATNFFTALLEVPGYHDLSPTMAAHRTQRNADPQHYQRYWQDAVLVVSTLLSDPSLIARLPASGVTADCTAAPAPDGSPPAAPAADCPAVAGTTEAGLRPVALRAARCTAAAFPAVRTMHGVGHRTGRSDHPRGLAVDFMIEEYRTAEGNAYGWRLAEWTRANAADLGVRYIIWDQRYWSAGNPDQGWVPYTRYGANPDDNLGHRNHVHVSYSA